MSDNPPSSREPVKMSDAAEMLWVVLANVSGGDWTKQTQEWQDAAARWRDYYFAALKDASPSREPGEIANRPRVICLCGSTRFIEMFAVKTWELELEGNIVLGCTLLPSWYCPVRDHFAETLGVKEQRDEHHLRKIDLADEVLVLNVEGYIGESTRAEIAYATRTGKPVNYLEPQMSEPGEIAETLDKLREELRCSKNAWHFCANCGNRVGGIPPQLLIDQITTELDRLSRERDEAVALMDKWRMADDEWQNNALVQRQRAEKAEATRDTLRAALEKIERTAHIVVVNSGWGNPKLHSFATGIEQQAIAALVASPVEPQTNEGMLFRQLSDILTGGNAATWDEVLDAASKAKALAARNAAPVEPWGETKR